ncbi:MAG: class I tRNA ligase family protein [Nitrospiraceae bacterium]
MSNPNTFYITTPIYYVNDVPHIGQGAYTTIAADVLPGTGDSEVVTCFSSPASMNMDKRQQAAAKAGIDPQAHCDRLAPQFKNLWHRLNI